MQASRFKPTEELAGALQNKRRVALFACTICANFSRTGGHQGLRSMQGLMRELGKEVLVARCITGCCLESVVSAAFKHALPPVAHRCEALIMLSCSSGVKTAWRLSPGIPVIAACDSVGSRPVSPHTEQVSESICHGCEHCVLSYTAGICPRDRCPYSPYGPCAKAPLNAEQGTCAVDPRRTCVWKEIIACGGDLQALANLKSMTMSTPRPVIRGGTSNQHPLLTRSLAWILSETSGIVSRLVPFLD